MVAIRTQLQLLNVNDYDYVIVSFSGGKDSQACVLECLDLGVDPGQLELWHQHIDGGSAGSFMDWPCTPAYCEAWANELGLTHRSQWKEGGFHGEMLRQEARTKGVFAQIGGQIKYIPPSSRGKKSTRCMFPQKSNDLNVRWCSAYLKIDVAARAIANDPALKDAKILFITGERREESPGRAKLAATELHRTHGKRRLVHHYRLVIDHNEQRVWDVIRNAGMVPHPAYRLGWSRLSCMSCIYGDADQWATIRWLANHHFGRISWYEQLFGKTINTKRVKGETVQLPVLQVANEGTVFPATRHATRRLRQQALCTRYEDVIRVSPANWELPAGAFKESGGPT